MVFDSLRDRQFMALTTYRRDGRPVPTTVWFAHHEDGIVVATGASTGKVKRIRANGTVTMVASSVRGTPKGDDHISGEARVLQGDDVAAARDALASKYGWQWRMFARNVDTVIEITPTRA